MRLHSLFARRPSAALVVSLVALFVALGGASYAAVFLPSNSVGTDQLQFHAVTGNKIALLSVGFRKIQFGAVGIRRINTNQVQARINGACAPFSTVSAVDNAGNVTCNSTLPAEIGTGTAATNVTSTAATVATAPLPGGVAYMILANPQADVTAAAGTQVQVDCTLTAGLSTQTRSVTFQGGAAPHQLGSIPLAITVPSATNGSTMAVSCKETPTTGTPTVAVTTNMNAIQISSISTPAAAMARAAVAGKK